MNDKIVFAGGSDFCLPTFSALNQYHYIHTVMVLKEKTQPNPLVSAANHTGIDIITVSDLRTEADEELLTRIEPDLIITCSFGHIIPEKLLVLPTKGWINIHASLLPRWRGASPIQHALLHGDTETGVTIFKLNRDVDCGEVILQRGISIEPDDNYISLSKKLSDLSASMIHQAIGMSKTKEQGIGVQATHAPKISKGQGKIKWDADAVFIDRQIRAFCQWPKSWCIFGNNEIIVIKSKPIGGSINTAIPGHIMIQKGKLLVACGKGLLEVVELQPQGKRKMNASDFINGYIKNARTDLFE